jgi:hypothetical protein
VLKRFDWGGFLASYRYATKAEVQIKTAPPPAAELEAA